MVEVGERCKGKDEVSKGQRHKVASEDLLGSRAPTVGFFFG